MLRRSGFKNWLVNPKQTWSLLWGWRSSHHCLSRRSTCHLIWYIILLYYCVRSELIVGVGSRFHFCWSKTDLCLSLKINSFLVESEFHLLFGSKRVYDRLGWKSTHSLLDTEWIQSLVQKKPILLGMKLTQVMFSVFCEVIYKKKCSKRQIFPEHSIRFYKISIPSLLADSRKFFI